MPGGSAQDALTGFYVTAAGRAFEVALMTTGLVVGVVLALQVGDKLQVDITPPAFTHPDLGDLMYQVPAAAFTAAFFALASYAPPRALLGAGLGGLTSFILFGICWVLYGIASVRARVFPAAISWAIVAGGLLSGVPIGLVYLSGGVILGLAFVALGAWWLRSGNARDIRDTREATVTG